LHCSDSSDKGSLELVQNNQFVPFNAPNDRFCHKGSFNQSQIQQLEHPLSVRSGHKPFSAAWLDNGLHTTAALT